MIFKLSIGFNNISNRRRYQCENINREENSKNNFRKKKSIFTKNQKILYNRQKLMSEFDFMKISIIDIDYKINSDINSKGDTKYTSLEEKRDEIINPLQSFTLCASYVKTYLSPIINTIVLRGLSLNSKIDPGCFKIFREKNLKVLIELKPLKTSTDILKPNNKGDDNIEIIKALSASKDQITGIIIPVRSSANETIDMLKNKVVDTKSATEKYKKIMRELGYERSLIGWLIEYNMNTMNHKKAMVHAACGADEEAADFVVMNFKNGKDDSFCISELKEGAYKRPLLPIVYYIEDETLSYNAKLLKKLETLVKISGWVFSNSKIVLEVVDSKNFVNYKATNLNPSYINKSIDLILYYSKQILPKKEANETIFIERSGISLYPKIIVCPYLVFNTPRNYIKAEPVHPGIIVNKYQSGLETYDSYCLDFD